MSATASRSVASVLSAMRGSTAAPRPPSSGYFSSDNLDVVFGNEAIATKEALFKRFVDNVRTYLFKKTPDLFYNGLIDTYIKYIANELLRGMLYACVPADRPSNTFALEEKFKGVVFYKSEGWKGEMAKGKHWFNPYESFKGLVLDRMYTFSGEAERVLVERGADSNPPSHAIEFRISKNPGLVALLIAVLSHVENMDVPNGPKDAKCENFNLSLGKLSEHLLFMHSQEALKYMNLEYVRRCGDKKIALDRDVHGKEKFPFSASLQPAFREYFTPADAIDRKMEAYNLKVSGFALNGDDGGVLRVEYAFATLRWIYTLAPIAGGYATFLHDILRGEHTSYVGVAGDSRKFEFLPSLDELYVFFRRRGLLQEHMLKISREFKTLLATPRHRILAFLLALAYLVCIPDEMDDDKAVNQMKINFPEFLVEIQAVFRVYTGQQGDISLSSFRGVFDAAKFATADGRFKRACGVRESDTGKKDHWTIFDVLSVGPQSQRPFDKTMGTEMLGFRRFLGAGKKKKEVVSPPRKPGEARMAHELFLAKYFWEYAVLVDAGFEAGYHIDGYNTEKMPPETEKHYNKLVRLHKATLDAHAETMPAEDGPVPENIATLRENLKEANAAYYAYQKVVEEEMGPTAA